MLVVPNKRAVEVEHVPFANADSDKANMYRKLETAFGMARCV